MFLIPDFMTTTPSIPKVIIGSQPGSALTLDVSVAKKLGDFSLTSRFSLTGNYGILGPSGSGKSTLLHILAGLTKPDHGRIVLNSTTIFDSEKKINLPAWQRRIGVVFQHARLFPHLSVKKNLLYGWKRIAPKDRRVDMEMVIDSLGLSSLLTRNPQTLSGGERQRVALGRAMLASPRFILLDEPLTGLDQEMKEQVIPYLRKALGDSAIPFLLISHSLEEVRLMTEKVLVFRSDCTRKATVMEMALA